MSTKVKILFRGDKNRIRAVQEEDKVILVWRYKGKTVRRECVDRSEAFNVVRATWPLANIVSAD